MSAKGIFLVLLRRHTGICNVKRQTPIGNIRSIFSTDFCWKQASSFVCNYESFHHQHFRIQFRCIGSSSSRVDKNGFKQKVDLDFPEQKVKVFTCEDLYNRWRTNKRFWRIPSSGVYATLTYVDTMIRKDGKPSRITESSPTVLCIHGIPGNYNVFSHLIKEFADHGVRAIVPNFPDVLSLPGESKEELFRHSVEEKTQIFLDFLKALDISKVDAIVAHSSAIYPALRLALNPELKVKCQILFNTGGHKPTVSMRPYFIVWIWAYLYLHPWGRICAHKPGKFVMKYIMRSPIKEDNFDGVMLLAITMVFSEYPKAMEQFHEIARRRFPTLLCFSENDKIVERKLSYEVISMLGASRANVSYYDENANLITEGKDMSWLRILSFKKGSHYVFRKHPEICNKEAINMLEKYVGSCFNTENVPNSSLDRANSGIETDKNLQNRYTVRSITAQSAQN